MNLEIDFSNFFPNLNFNIPIENIHLEGTLSQV